MKQWRCTVCGYIFEGQNPPEACPQCKAPASKFEEVKEDGNMVWAAEHQVGIAKDVDEEIKAGLRANFEGECSEVGMYLAMSRVAFRPFRRDARRGRDLFDEEEPRDESRCGVRRNPG